MKKIKWTILIAVAVLVLISPACGDDKPNSQEKKIGATSEKVKKKSVKKVVTDKKETLRGFGEKAMGVVIEELDFKTIELGLTEDIIRTDVELKLKSANIKVFFEMTPYLYIRVTSFFIKNIPDHVVYSISIAARQEVVLTSLRVLKWDRITKRKAFESLCDKDIKTTESICERVRKGQLIGQDEKNIIGCTASIWESGSVGIVPTSEMENTIRDEIKDLVDIFLNDYLAVNPKQVDKPKKK